MVSYQIKVRDGSDTEIGEFVTYRNLTFGKRLNNFGTCSFEVPANDERANSLVALRIYTVWIYRIEDGVSTLVWSGEQAYRKGTLVVDKNNWVQIFCYTWFEQLKNRYTADVVVFSAEDQGQIIVDLIDGAFGITEGTVVATVDRDRTYYNQNILNAIVDITNLLGGLDFEITDNRVLNADSVIGVDRSDSVVLEYGFNIVSCDVIEDFTNPVNRAIVLGQAEGEDELQRIERDDAASQALYQLRENTITDNDISELDTFEEKGDALLRKYGSRLFQIEPDILQSGVSITSFALGDSIRLRINTGIYDVDESYRIFEYTVKYDARNTESLKLVLGNFTL